MSKKRKRNGKDKRKNEPVGNLADPYGMAVLMDKFLEWLEVTNYSPRTVKARRQALRSFIRWSEERGLVRPNEITKPILERYQRHLFHYRKKDGHPLSFRSQHSQLVPVRAWFKWLTRNNHILYNPASELDLPRLEHRLPRHVLTIGEAESVMRVPDLNDPLGVRDRAILEVLYSTGIRRSEISNLKLYDIEFERGTLMIRQGKGKKDRVVPIGRRALNWLDKYIREVRPLLLPDPKELGLFVTHLGEAMTPSHLASIVRRCVNNAEITKHGSCHLFRHTMATLMLENGADVRYVQAMLGHANLETTQIYTQVSIAKLKEIHEATHPAKDKRNSESSTVESTTETESKPEASASEKQTDESSSDESEKPKPR